MMDDIAKHIGFLLAGISGGAVTLIQEARYRKKPHTLKHVVGSLFVSAFAAWLMSQITIHLLVSEEIKMISTGISGMCADRLLGIIVERFLQEVKQ